MERYNSSFSPGMKVEIRIPVPHAHVFCDWAVIKAIAEDMVTLQLSRDMLPEGINLRVGQVLECHNVNDPHNRSHQAIIVSKGFDQQLQLRLIGEISADERREFFRIDIFPPIICHAARSHSTYYLQKQLKAHRNQRRADELNRRKKYQEHCQQLLEHRRRVLTGASTTAHPQDHHDEPEEFVPYHESWLQVIPHAVNICGGGMSLVTQQEYMVDDYVFLEILIPSTGQVIDLIARVIFVSRNYITGHHCKLFTIGMQFVFMEENERSAIVTYITSIQSLRIRRIQGFIEKPLYAPNQPDDRAIEHKQFGNTLENPASTPFNWLSLVMIIVMFIICGLAVSLIHYLASSAIKPENDMGKRIEKSFETIRDSQK